MPLQSLQGSPPYNWSQANHASGTAEFYHREAVRVRKKENLNMGMAGKDGNGKAFREEKVGEKGK